MQIQEALSAALVHGLCIRRAAPIGKYYCIKPTKPGEPLLFLKTGKYADRKPRLWNPEPEDILAGDWILTAGDPTGSLGGEDAAGDAAQQVEAERTGLFQNR